MIGVARHVQAYIDSRIPLVQKLAGTGMPKSSFRIAWGAKSTVEAQELRGSIRRLVLVQEPVRELYVLTFPVPGAERNSVRPLHPLEAWPSLKSGFQHWEYASFLF